MVDFDSDQCFEVPKADTEDVFRIKFIVRLNFELCMSTFCQKKYNYNDRNNNDDNDNNTSNNNKFNNFIKYAPTVFSFAKILVNFNYDHCF